MLLWIQKDFTCVVCAAAYLKATSDMNVIWSNKDLNQIMCIFQSIDNNFKRYDASLSPSWIRVTFLVF